jgi:cyclopropane-fatty-acyl-phospholipid synthase
MIERAIGLAERGWLPDSLIRWGVRGMLERRLREEAAGDCERAQERMEAWLDEVRGSPVAIETRAANAQHYELPPDLFGLILGPWRKYSACLWRPGTRLLAHAEEEMLALTCERAGIEDGMRVLDLGCGWGSLSTWIARNYPHCRVLALSNSKDQREHILSRRDTLGLTGLEVVTADVNYFEASDRFDRVVSVEMFEHVRNHPLLLSRIARWLEPEGRLFVHAFCHRSLAYPYEAEGESNWMGRHFFTGGMMPSDAWLLRCQDDLRVLRQWRLSGEHYQRTLDAWLRNLDTSRELAREILQDVYGPDQASIWLQRWRLFLLACSELFGYRGGQEWWVGHYLFGLRALRSGDA